MVADILMNKKAPITLVLFVNNVETAKGNAKQSHFPSGQHSCLAD